MCRTCTVRSSSAYLTRAQQMMQRPGLSELNIEKNKDDHDLDKLNHAAMQVEGSFHWTPCGLGLAAVPATPDERVTYDARCRSEGCAVAPAGIVALAVRAGRLPGCQAPQRPSSTGPQTAAAPPARVTRQNHVSTPTRAVIRTPNSTCIYDLFRVPQAVAIPQQSLHGSAQWDSGTSLNAGVSSAAHLLDVD